MTALAKAADIVLPGAAWVEKDATTSTAQAGCRPRRAVITPPGEAQEDWQVLVNVGRALGADVRTRAAPKSGRHWPPRWPAIRSTRALEPSTFSRPVAAAHWLQASNPSERWKWDLMFQDLPPVKFAATPRAEPVRLVIPVRKADEAGGPGTGGPGTGDQGA